MGRRELPVISLFSGALGLDLGLEAAGFSVRVAVECNRFAAETIRRNRPDIKLIEKRLEYVPTSEILDAAGLRPGEPAVVTGGPSCQAFSTAGQRGSVRDPRGTMFREFLRVVREAQPRFFVMENVRGVLSAALRHRPLGERGPGHPELKPEEELGSAFALIARELEESGYYVVFDLLNAADFGVPQVRERVLFIGSRDGEPVTSPIRTHAKTPHGDIQPWLTLCGALQGLDDPTPTFNSLTPTKRKFMVLVPTGGNWRDLPDALQPEALGAAFKSWGGRAGFFRRLSWDRPAPALTTRPDSKATMLCHPTQLRPLSLKEYARLQQFPDQWEFGGGVPQQYIQIGNAVPVGLGRAVGLALLQAMRKRRRVPQLGIVVCADDALLDRLSNRPRTILNPVRMRIVKDHQAAKTWLAGGRRRHQFSP
jgi:DNA (cytosine-5)-methyltransferase 1